MNDPKFFIPVILYLTIVGIWIFMLFTVDGFPREWAEFNKKFPRKSLE